MNRGFSVQRMAMVKTNLANPYVILRFQPAVWTGLNSTTLCCCRKREGLQPSSACRQRSRCREV